jgi:hypothetical protein
MAKKKHKEEKELKVSLGDIATFNKLVIQEKELKKNDNRSANGKRIPNLQESMERAG